MPQDRESGAAGRTYGLKMAKGLAHCLGLTLVRAGSNEVVWKGRPAVIKTCGSGTSSFGVTSTMLGRLATILAAFEKEDGEVQVWELDAARFQVGMYDSRSSGAICGRVKMVARSFAEREGRPVARFSRLELEAAARA